MDEYPKMMYQAGGVELIHGRPLMTFVVNDAIEEAVAIEEGWHASTTPPEATEPLRRGPGRPRKIEAS